MQDQGFLVLGSQMLTALRDNIYCLADEVTRKAKLHVPSGYFYIEVCKTSYSVSFDATFESDLKHRSSSHYFRAAGGFSIFAQLWITLQILNLGVFSYFACIFSRRMYFTTI
jgi:hypothetical protein